MALKYYSDRTNKFYNSVEEANRAEFELKEKENLAKIEQERKIRAEKEKKEKAVAERKALATEVDTARKAYLEAQKAYRDKLEKFCEKYGTYHYTVENSEEIPSLFDFLGDIFKF